jgi:hypothetical protein
LLVSFSLAFLNHPGKEDIRGLILIQAALLAYGFSDDLKKESRNSVAFALKFSIGLACLILLGRHFWPEEPPAPAPPPIAVYMGCDWDHLPITIPAASTAHILELEPHILRGNPNFPDLGVLQNLSSSADKSREWPSKLDGHWLSFAEITKRADRGDGIGAANMFKCELSSVSPVTIEGITAHLLVMPSKKDSKGWIYPIAFDPLMSGTKFPFYVVSPCQDDIYTNWMSDIQVKVLGETAPRIVSLHIVKRSFPGGLMWFPPSMFQWTAINKCDWKWPQ